MGYIEREPAAEHSPWCASFMSWHEQAKDGEPGRWHAVPCDCGLE